MGASDIPPFDSSQYPIKDIDKLKLGIVKSEWNKEIIDRLTNSCLARFKELGINDDQITTLSVPGSFELPWGAKQYITKGGYHGIICFGCVIQGQTKHDDYINHSVARAIMNMNLAGPIPVLFGVLTTNTMEQALERSGGSRGDKGSECAESVLKMISAAEQLRNQKQRIGF